MTYLEWVKELLQKIGPVWAVIIVIAAMFFSFMLRRVDTRAFWAALCVTLIVIAIAAVVILTPPPEESYIIAGTVEYEGSQTIAKGRIVFSAGAKLRILHGATITFKADEIVIEGPVTILGQGDKGTTGKNGGKGSPTTVIKQHREVWTSGSGGGKSATENWQDACNGDPPDNRGEDGGQGGQGGPGANVILIAKKITGTELIELSAAGGMGGDGGSGGEGRTHVNGDNPTQTCLGRSGATGPEGAPGPDGELTTRQLPD